MSTLRGRASQTPRVTRANFAHAKYVRRGHSWGTSSCSASQHSKKTTPKLCKIPTKCLARMRHGSWHPDDVSVIVVTDVRSNTGTICRGGTRAGEDCFAKGPNRQVHVHSRRPHRSDS